MNKRMRKPGDNAFTARLLNVISYVILVGSCLVSLFPIFYALMGSFKSNMDFITGRGGIIPQTFHPDNYVRAWETANFARYTFNSVFITLLAIVGSLIVTSMAGYVFARGEFPGKKFIMGLFLGSMFLATGAITIFPVYRLIRTMSLNTSLWGLILVYTFSINVANIYLVNGFVRGLPRELDEAASMDGCGFFSTYLRVILPLTKPILATTSLLTFKTVWNDYLLPMVFTLANDDLKTLTVGVVSLRSSGGGAGAYDIMLAGTAISLIPMVIFYAFTSKFFIGGITAGAVKG